MKTKTILFVIIVALSAVAGGCRTIYVDRPYYVTQHDSISYIDTLFVFKVDTVKKIVSTSLKNPIAEINTKFLHSKAWIASDSLFLESNLKNIPDTAKAKNTIRYITNTPAPIVITKTVKVYTHSDRLFENLMYICGWIFWGLIFICLVYGIIKIGIKLKA